MYINTNPRVRQIHGTIKLHKQDRPIRPIVNWKERRRYKICKHLNTILNKTLTLPNSFKVQNSYSLAQSLRNIKIDKNTKLCLFDIENRYTNIPMLELKDIIKKT
jgi:hypothetical protein